MRRDKMKRAKKNEWLLIKHRDEAADKSLADGTEEGDDRG